MAAEAKLRATTAGVVQLLQNFTHFFHGMFKYEVFKSTPKEF